MITASGDNLNWQITFISDKGHYSFILERKWRRFQIGSQRI